MNTKFLRFAFIGLALIGLASSHSLAQLVLPQPSPRCGKRLSMGVTDLEIDFGSPAVNGRVIWGGLVPYDEIWRSGANAATWISFSTEVSFGGQTVKAGKYALYIIPRADKPWTVALNSNEGQWGSTSFKENLDIVRIEASVSKAASFRERMVFELDYLNSASANLRLHWENLEMVLPISADVKALGMNNVRKFFADRPGDWYPCANAAIFALEQGNDQAYAIELALKAVRLNGEHFFPRWVLARVHAARGEFREASEQAEQARLKGEAENSDWYQGNAGDIAARKAEWSAKASPVSSPAKKKGK